MKNGNGELRNCTKLGITELVYLWQWASANVAHRTTLIFSDDSPSTSTLLCSVGQPVPNPVGNITTYPVILEAGMKHCVLRHENPAYGTHRLWSSTA